MTPSSSLQDSANRLARAGKCQSAAFARRMVEAATVWPELHEDYARQLREHADRIETESA